MFRSPVVEGKHRPAGVAVYAPYAPPGPVPMGADLPFVDVVAAGDDGRPVLTASPADEEESSGSRRVQQWRAGHGGCFGGAR
ncbi:hypothetical protein ACIRU3_09705 [Streptomyces sp. NPDC101151]|uniref:hypothetical protein n=1 Tax=Streptomyces sp. NPDC101151 TaxID=3366115 RepID=UPI0037F62055